MPEHCPACTETVRDPPLPPGDAVRFGLAHMRAIVQQSVAGAHRALPFWLVPAGLAVAAARARGRRRSRLTHAAETAAGAVALHLAWTCGYAVVSGSRTAVRLTTLTSANLIPVEITCPHGPHVVADAHYSRIGGCWYLDGVFAWPRGLGGGSAVIRRLLARADAESAPIFLTAFSPRVAAYYRRVGFTHVAWIYLMRREPVPPSATDQMSPIHAADPRDVPADD